MRATRIWKRYGKVLLFLTSILFMVIIFQQGDVVVNLYNSRQVNLDLRDTEANLLDYSSWKIFDERKDTLLRVCQRNSTAYIGANSDNIVRSHFVVDRKHNFVYCAMEKIGSTFWRRLFQILSGHSRAKSPFDIPPGNALGGNVETFKRLAFDDIHKLLEESMKFIIVRDPYARLYSGYMDKLFSANVAFWNGIGRFAIKKFRTNATEKSVKCGHDLTFPEFIKYYIYSETFNKMRDGHFLPMYDHCRPCQIKYDVIAKMESMSKDTLSVLKMLNMTDLHDTLSKQFMEDTREDSFKDQTKILFSSFSRTTDCLNKNENQIRMWTKFKSRGLISKYAIFPFNEQESEPLNQEKYIKALKQAVKESADKSTSEKYRYEYLYDAYANVPKEDIRKLHQILQKDCKIFGYDCENHPWVQNAFRVD